MSVFHENMLIGSSGQGGAAAAYNIERSLRFNSADSARLSRTPASAGNRRTYTWAGWVKKTGSARQVVFASTLSATEIFAFEFNANEVIEIYDYTGAYDWRIVTTQVFRDPSAWFHLVFAFDTTQATASDRVKIYINGSQITTFSVATYPSLNYQGYINRTVGHDIGTYNAGAGLFLNGYLADIHFIDGQAKTPSDFAETNATTGQWVPKAYSGTYGTNGYKLTFSDNSGTTSTTLGKDTSGNNNNWTPSGFSVTAGTGNDSLVDTPTSYGTGSSGGDVRGNFATLNPLAKGSNVTLTNGNLDYACTLTSNTLAVSTIAMSSGKWYCEFTATSSNNIFGLYKASLTSDIAYVGVDANGWGYYSLNGNKYNNGSGTTYGSTFTTNDVIGVAFDADAGSLYFYKNGVAQNSGTAAFTGLTSGPYVFATGTNNGSISAVFNAGQRAFAYTAPSGFKALCDTNLTAPTIAKPNTVMDVVTYLGNGTSQSITGLGFSPDFVWIKRRSTTDNHRLFDTVRGATKQLYTDVTDAEGTNAQTLSSFDSTGFSLGDNQGVNAGTNNSYVAWTWDAGSSNATNTSGEITSTVRANLSAGFSVFSYTGPGYSVSVGHGLGAVPKFAIFKNRTTGGTNWIIYHGSLGPEKYMTFTTAAATTSGTAFANNSPDSSTFVLGSLLFSSSANYVCYAWAPVAGYSAFGSYTGNGSSDGPFVYTGFRPRWLMIKSSSTGGAGYNWVIVDTARDTYNLTEKKLYANLDLDEVVGSNNQLDILSNGFKLKSTNTATNSSSVTYVYACFAEAPLPYARAR